jgi:hypothetical protein
MCLNVDFLTLTMREYGLECNKKRPLIAYQVAIQDMKGWIPPSMAGMKLDTLSSVKKKQINQIKKGK